MDQTKESNLRKKKEKLIVDEILRKERNLITEREADGKNACSKYKLQLVTYLSFSFSA